MRDILTGIGVAFVVAALFVCAVSCSTPEKSEHDYIVDMITEKSHTVWPNILMAECKSGNIRHSTHDKWLIRMSGKWNYTIDEQAMVNHEFRQNIADLQNRVYELEND